MTAIRVPHHIFIDLSTACNATCVMCPTQIDSDRKKVMPDALFRKIANEASVFSSEIDSFYFGVHGEPLIDKRLEQKVALCSELGISRTIVSTNGSLLNESRAISLLDAKPWVLIVSLESMSADIYEKIRVGLSHAEVVSNLKRLIQIRNETQSRTRIAVRFITSEWNAAEKPEFVKFWTSLLDTTGRVDYVETDPIHNWGYGNPDAAYGTSPCPHIELMTILSDGAVSACCMDYKAVHHFGNVADEPLLEVFNGPLAMEFRAVHLARKRNTLKMCSTCNIAEFWSDRASRTSFERASRFVASEWISNR
jgi:sulfatase maturation enzyme AslB (radical SAM superfamily)